MFILSLVICAATRSRFSQNPTTKIVSKTFTLDTLDKLETDIPDIVALVIQALTEGGNNVSVLSISHAIASVPAVEIKTTPETSKH